MEKKTKLICETCKREFNTPDECIEHEKNDCPKAMFYNRIEYYPAMERLEQCTKDSHGQPLICYGCSHSAAYTKYYGSDKAVEGTDFPGMPSGERTCFFCIRNVNREEWQKEYEKNNNGRKLEFWYDGSKPIGVPMDCYHSVDMLKQIAVWEEKHQPSDIKINLVARIKKLLKR
jgi:hypothetical protein